MTTSTTTTRAPRTCTDCSQPFPVDAPPADCFHCAAEARREERHLERLRREARMRELLSTAPFDRATTMARLALVSAVEALEAGYPYASSAERADALQRTTQHVREAVRAIDAATAPTPGWRPRWPAP